MSKKPTVLMILDGYGLNEKCEANAVCEAKTPVMDSLMKEYPFVEGNASGMSVGLPEGQMGNSEVGHLNMGKGKQFCASSVWTGIRWWSAQSQQPHLRTFRTCKERRA